MSSKIKLKDYVKILQKEIKKVKEANEKLKLEIEKKQLKLKILKDELLASKSKNGIIFLNSKVNLPIFLYCNYCNQCNYVNKCN